MLETLTQVSFDKVTAFVLRDGDAGLELLTFLHPSAGRQIPAGSVELAEPPDAAAMREVMEETGVVGLQGLTQIGKSEETLGAQAIALHDTALVDSEGTQVDKIQRGHRVLVQAEQDGRMQVTRLVHDFNVDPPIQLSQPSGWAGKDRFARRVSRYFYLAKAANGGARKWEHAADGHLFEVEWCPLSADLTLIEGQQDWLTEYVEQLKQQPAGIAQ